MLGEVAGCATQAVGTSEPRGRRGGGTHPTKPEEPLGHRLERDEGKIETIQQFGGRRG